MRPSVLRRTIVDSPCAALKRVRAARSLALTRSPSRTDLVMFGGMLSGAYCRITIAHPPPDRQPDVFVRVEVFVCRCNLRPSMVLIFARDCRLRVRQRYLNTICFFCCRFFVVVLLCCAVAIVLVGRSRSGCTHSNWGNCAHRFMFLDNQDRPELSTRAHSNKIYRMRTKTNHYAPATPTRRHSQRICMGLQLE